jgi:hypothetical protein
MRIARSPRGAKVFEGTPDFDGAKESIGRTLPVLFGFGLNVADVNMGA